MISLLVFWPFKLTDKWNRPMHEDFSDENSCDYVVSGRHKLSAHIYGGQSTRGTIIFSHGMGVSSDYYIPEARYFAEEGYKVVLFDDTGYRRNRGLFRGFPQATKDLIAAVNKYSDNTAPLTLIGHSMGAYAVCTALADVGDKVSNIVVYSGFNSEREMIDEFVNANIKACKGLVKGVLRLSQKLNFWRLYGRHADECLRESGCPAMIIHGTKDREVAIDGASIYAKLVDNPPKHVTIVAVANDNVNTHMGVIRPENKRNEINTEVMRKVNSFLQASIGD